MDISIGISKIAGIPVDVLTNFYKKNNLTDIFDAVAIMDKNISTEQIIDLCNKRIKSGINLIFWENIKNKIINNQRPLYNR